MALRGARQRHRHRCQGCRARVRDLPIIAPIRDKNLDRDTELEFAKNGLAVVTIKRDSCSGCFNQIPPQRQLDIRQRKRIIVCEHCGRIVVDEGYAEEVVPAAV